MGKLLVLEKQRMITRLGDIWEITEKGKQLLGQERRETPVTLQQDWVEELYEQIEGIIVKNTGKKQYMNKSGKYLKPANVQMLKDRFTVFFKKFGQQDVEKIKSTMLYYVNQVTTGQHQYAVTLLYFIFKEGKSQGNYESQLLEWMEVEQEKEEVENIVTNTKELF